MSPKEEIEQLRELLHQHNYNYYVLNQPTISDFEFDQLMHKLQDLEMFYPQFNDPNSPTQRVGSDINQSFKQMKHKYPMLSLANTYNINEVRDFYQRVKTGLEGENFEIVAELKYDGLSISLTYINGELIHAVTRGDGEKGDIVTDNVRTIRSIPLKLKSGTGYPDEFEIRGEILMPWSSFNKLNIEREKKGEPLFANPRNAASGTLKSQKSELVAHRQLDAYLYYLLGDSISNDSSHYANLQMAQKWGFKISQGMKLCKTISDVEDYINFWDVERKNLPVATDGIVLKVNSIRQQQHLGYTAKSPRWAIAYKFQAEKACTKLNMVTYQVGRTGAITPVANMEPVQLSGTIVKRASLHNADIIKQLDLHIGDMVYVEKGGEIIPKVVGVDKSKRKDDMIPVEFIRICPACGTDLIRMEGEAAHYCPNENHCPPQIKGRIEHFISRKAMNIESIGPETVEDYYKRGLVKNVADLYDLRISDIDGVMGTKVKSAKKVIDGIKNTVNVPFDRVLYALGIRFVGETTAKILAKKFKSIDALIQADINDLLLLDGIGEVIAKSVVLFFSDKENLAIIQKLKDNGVQMSMKDSQNMASDKLQGKSIVISGVFNHHSRDEYKEIIENNGGKNVSSISSKTAFVLAGDNMGPSKLEKAKKLNIEIISEDEFLNMIN